MASLNAPLSRRLLFRLVTSESLQRAVRVTPPVRALAWRWARRYVAGTSIEDALTSARQLAQRGMAASLDMFGERVTDPVVADRVTGEYVVLAQTVATAAPPGTWLSLDLSHLALATDPSGARRRLLAIVEALPSGARVQIGAEEAALAERTLDAVLAVPDRGSVMATVQANLRRSAEDAERLAAAGVAIRLVKGAYVESPMDAVPYGEPTNRAYVGLAERLARLDAEVSFATHDPVLRARCLEVLPGAGVEMLLGVQEGDARRLVDEGLALRLYVPYGPNWLRYWLRRLAESRGAPAP